jgi:hypothetical protein
MSAPRIDLIRQALSAAESSIKLARQLLSELEKEGGREKPKAKEMPGTIGMFDGQTMVTEQGETFPVPENYASKSILVVGDTLKLVEDGGEKRFKQIEHVKRHKTAGILAKKDGKWTVVSSEGSYRVLPASVSHFEGDVGDEVLLQLPANSLQTTWAAVENITKKGAKKAMPTGRQETKAAPETTETKQEKEKAPPAIKKEEKPKEAVPASRQEPKAKEKEAVPASGQEIKPKAEEAKVAPVAKEPEEKKEEPKEKSTAQPEVKPVTSEPKPAVPEIKSTTPPEPKPAPAESKPASDEPKPATEEMAEDELR